MEHSHLTIILPDGSSHPIPIYFTNTGQTLICGKTVAKTTGYQIYDSELRHTTTELANLSYLDAEALELYYRGIPIQLVVENCDYLDTIILLYESHLPSQEEKQWFSKQLAKHSILDQQIIKGLKSVISSFSSHANPVAILSSGLSYLSGESSLPLRNQGEQSEAIFKALAITPILVGMIVQHVKQQPLVLPQDVGCDGQSYDYINNLLGMICGFGNVTDEQRSLMDKLMVLHADAGLSPSTFAAKQNISNGTGMWRSLISALNALSGDKHGGANFRVLQMFQEIAAADGDLEDNIRNYIQQSLAQKQKIPGLGHIEFKGIDPRARILGKICHQMVEEGKGDTFMHIAKEMHKQIDTIPYFDKIKPNVDFYSGVLWKNLGIPDQLMIVMFYCSRIAGYIANICLATEKSTIVFPNQAYVGKTNLFFNDVEPSTSGVIPLFPALTATLDR